jgi:hypothetical protein
MIVVKRKIFLFCLGVFLCVFLIFPECSFSDTTQVEKAMEEMSTPKVATGDDRLTDDTETTYCNYGGADS